MKKLLHYLLLMSVPACTLAQETAGEKHKRIRTQLELLRDSLQEEVELWNPFRSGFIKPNDDQAFNEVYKRVFSTVVLGKTDAVANGSAFSYTQDNNKSVFSINATKMPKAKTSFLLDGGISLKSKDNSYSYYQKGKWSNDITLKVGVAIKLPLGKGFWNDEDAAEANKARSAYFDKEYQKYRQLLKDGTHITTDEDQMNSMEAELVDVPALFKKIKDKYGKSDDATKPYHGYRIAWVNLNGSYTNSSFSIANDSIITETIQEKFSSVSKFSIELNLNYHEKGLTNFFIAQLYSRFNRVSILDNVDLVDKKIKVSPLPADGGYSLYYYDSDTTTVTHFGDYSDIHAPVLTFDYGLYIANLFGKKQTFGINSKINFSTPYGQNDYNFERSYSVLIGPMIRLAKDKLFSSATFTFNAGFENAKYSENAWDKFVFKVSAAIPFNVFEKSK